MPVFFKTSPWPGLKAKTLKGIGKIKAVATFKADSERVENGKDWLNRINKELVAQSLTKNKVVAIIEGDDGILARIQPILESGGAAMIYEKVD